MSVPPRSSPGASAATGFPRSAFSLFFFHGSAPFKPSHHCLVQGSQQQVTLWLVAIQKEVAASRGKCHQASLACLSWGPAGLAQVSPQLRSSRKGLSRGALADAGWP